MTSPGLRLLDFAREASLLENDIILAQQTDVLRGMNARGKAFEGLQQSVESTSKAERTREGTP